MLFDVFFFKQKTAYEMRISDWSSDVCSSDLGRTLPCRAKAMSSARTPCKTERERPSAKGDSASASAQFATQKSRQPAAANCPMTPGASVPSPFALIPDPHAASPLRCSHQRSEAPREGQEGVSTYKFRRA